jgi:hypothetical protein
MQVIVFKTKVFFSIMKSKELNKSYYIYTCVCPIKLTWISLKFHGSMENK